ncbi:MAG: hypothetical protein K0U11_01920 [Gammaproteobacteria bacterium]|nr:hypothetical protein [Gammaproteobacteria bacterium]
MVISIFHSSSYSISFLTQKVWYALYFNTLNTKVKHGIIIIHDRGNHWLLASTVNSVNSNVIEVYDSMYATIDKDSKIIINIYLNYLKTQSTNI